MNSSQIPAPIAMPCPFANPIDGTTTASVTDVATTASESTVNFPKGFGNNYASPASSGGKYVTRPEMNGFGKALAVDPFRTKCGIINTFDPNFAAAIGGYPKGAVLNYVVDGQLVHVESLIEDNLVDFRDLVDGINWRVLNEEQGEIPRNVIQRYNVSTAGNIVLGVIKATDNIILSANIPEIKKSAEIQIAAGSGLLYGYVGDGYSVAVLDLGTSGSTSNIVFPSFTLTVEQSTTTMSANWANWNSIGGNFKFYAWYPPHGSGGSVENEWTQQSFPMVPTVVSLSTGHYYAIGLISDGYINSSAHSSAHSYGYNTYVSASPFSLSGNIEIYATNRD